MCVFGVCLSYRVTWTSTLIASGSSRENENGTSTSSRTARVPGPKISTSCATLTVAHDNLAPSTLTLTWTVILIWTKTSILNPCPYACVLCSYGRGMPCVRRLHSGDTSPCVSADYGGGTGTAGVLGHAQLLDGLKTFSRLVGLRICEAGGRGPCLSLERAKKDVVDDRNLFGHVTWHAPSRLCFSPTPRAPISSSFITLSTLVSMVSTPCRVVKGKGVPFAPA